MCDALAHLQIHALLFLVNSTNISFLVHSSCVCMEIFQLLGSARAKRHGHNGLPGTIHPMGTGGNGGTAFLVSHHIRHFGVHVLFFFGLF